MNISATYKGDSVNIVSVDVVGQELLIGYVDGSSVLHVDKLYIPIDLSTLVIATNCTIIS
jgi:hypothetical protein